MRRGGKHAPLFKANLIAPPVSSAIVLPVGGMTDRRAQTMLLGWDACDWGPGFGSASKQR